MISDFYKIELSSIYRQTRAAHLADLVELQQLVAPVYLEDQKKCSPYNAPYVRDVFPRNAFDMISAVGNLYSAEL